MNYAGTVSARGIAVGRVFLYSLYIPTIDRVKISDSDITKEIDRYHKAHERAKYELNALLSKMLERDQNQAKIFQAHMDILDDVVMADEITGVIEGNCWNANQAVDFVYTQYADILKESPNQLISERSADMLDVRHRLLRCLEDKPENELATLKEPVILVTQDLLPSDTAVLDPKMVQAIITEYGGATSHSAIIARSYGIPALAGIQNVCNLLKNGDMVVVDALEGQLITNPNPEEVSQYEQKWLAFLQQCKDEQEYSTVKACTVTGERVQVLANIGTGSEKELSCAGVVDGVGLFRTEFLYMGRSELPSEEEQYQHYRKVFEAFSPNPVTLRTLDIGGDKKADCLELPAEENSFLGNRALRLCFDREDVFLTQLRAVLRASIHGKVKLMFPMVSSIEDIHRAKAALEKAKSQLAERGMDWNHDMEVGVMIEIPALALMADMVAKEVDFASIGTNDLVQYTLAVDRVNPAVSQYYRPFHPAIMRLLNYIIQEFRMAGKGISVCGEMGGDPVAATALLGMGIRTLSAGAASVPAIKKLVCTLDIQKAQKCVKDICMVPTADEVQNRLKAIMPQ